MADIAEVPDAVSLLRLRAPLVEVNHLILIKADQVGLAHIISD